MKKLSAFFLLLVFASALLHAAPLASPTGAWRSEGQSQGVMIVTEAYWVQTQFSTQPATFIHTRGGPFVREDDAYACTVQFDSQDPKAVGSEARVTLLWEGSTLAVVHEDGTTERWERIDAAAAPLAGVWRISGREVDGALVDMPLRARRTLKVLSGTRFQWIAMNIETGEFSGTGGGTYTFKDGKYVETIDFFSRDNSRVGAVLSFDARLDGSHWHHRGRSSKGDPIYEVWTRF
jgi:hypothetical protein